MNRWHILFVALLACLALPLGHAAAMPLGSESEPNNTQATANPIALGQTLANNDSPDDVDWFKLNLPAGQSLHLELAYTDVYFSHLELGFYNAAGVLLAVGDYVLPEVTVPATGTYYIRVTNPDDYAEDTGPYKLGVFLNSAGEPVDNFADATPLVFGGAVASVLDWPGDWDYFTFNGLAGEVVDIHVVIPGLVSEWPALRLSHEANEWLRAESTQGPGESIITVVLPVTGRYEVYTWADDLRDSELNAPAAYTITLDRLGLYVSGKTAGQAGGVPFGPNDILVRNIAGQWRKVFDGEDVGLTKPLNAFERLPDGSYLMALGSPQLLGNLGTVKPQDVVRFVPTALGAQTAGQFEWYLRGVDAGLTTNTERIDAIGRSGDGKLLLSTTGTATVPAAGGGALTIPDQGILVRQGSAWAVYMSGIVDGYPTFANEDIAALTRVTQEGTFNHGNSALFITLDSAYRFADGYYGGYGHQVNSAKGDMLGLQDQTEVLMEARRTLLGFAKPITNLSLGPAWQN
jgi:hypothetical protein